MSLPEQSSAIEFVRKVAGLTKTERRERSEQDKARYHPTDPKDYGSSIGIEDKDGNRYCVGCWHCEPEGATRWTLEAREILREAGEDY